MTVQTTQVRVSYTGDGTTTSFPIPFAFYLASDLMVVRAGTQITSGFSISGGGSGTPLVSNLGTLVMATPPAAGINLQIILNVPLTQLVALVDGTAFPSPTLNQVNDRAVQGTQRANDILMRSIRAPDGDVSPALLLPPAQTRAGLFLGFDANGNALTLATGPGTSNTQASLGPVLYPQTGAEAAAQVAPVNYIYPPYTVDRYGTNSTPGETDMWPAIFAADKAANAAGASVNFIPGAVYGVHCTNNGGNLTISSSWVCNGPRATIQRLDFTTQTAYYTARMLSQSNLILRGLIFDGQVTATTASQPNVDIGAIGSFNDDGTESKWSKPYGVQLAYTQNCTVEDCVFQNFLRCGLRIDCEDNVAVASGPPWSSTISLGNRVVNCKFIRNRGTFGDGFYAEEYEDLTLESCYAYDYQRQGFSVGINGGSGYVGANGTLASNCVADFGHDACGGQSNTGFWLEGGDSYELVNCESKNTSLGFVSNAAGGAATGSYRPWTASHVYKGCKAIRCQQQGFRLEYASTDAHVVLENCFAEVNRAAAQYSVSFGGAPAGVEIDFAPSTAITAARFELKGCAFDMVGFSAASLTQYSAINVHNGGVTNPYQMKVDIRDCSSRWIKNGAFRASDTAVQGAYESTTAPNYGYIADILFSGANNGGNRFAGKATISNFVNHTFGYCMISSEIASANSVLTISDTFCSLRTGGATSNLGILQLSDCSLVDYRGNIGFNYVFAANSFFADADMANKDRTEWGDATIFHLSNCLFTRQLMLTANADAATNHYTPTLTAVNCRWNIVFATEPGIRVQKPTGYTSLLLSGCAFQDAGSTGSPTNGMIFVAASDQNVALSGAGNTFDNTYLLLGGHCTVVNTSVYDTPSTASGVYQSVFGVKLALS